MVSNRAHVSAWKSNESLFSYRVQSLDFACVRFQFLGLGFIFFVGVQGFGLAFGLV